MPQATIGEKCGAESTYRYRLPEALVCFDTCKSFCKLQFNICTFEFYVSIVMNWLDFLYNYHFVICYTLY